ncbi:sensor histidine kinase [Tellurirhabdus rosea]|uniref:sensor histidine kinase n=1 Tax=Tellurirhabdus rosea TaxID=2674997 RepID=UPI00224FB69F|nr:ATP-binding protein [Tellurirhabdus rosea]
MNIRTRLTLVFALMVASILLLFSVVIYLTFSQYRGTEFRQRLSERAEAIRRVFGDSPTGSEALRQQLNDLDIGGLYQSSVTLYTPQGRQLVTWGTIQPVLTAAQQAEVRRGRELWLPHDEAELLATPYRDPAGNTFVLAVSAVDRYGYSKLSRLRQIIISGWLVSLGLVLLAGYLFAGDALKPVSGIIRQVKTISATNINARLRIGRQRDELTNLSITFNDMLARLEEGFTAQKNFVSYASHELRTPITAMIGHIEVSLMQERSPDEYRELLKDLLNEARSMKQLVNGLLELAYASADASTLTFTPARVDELLFQAQETLAKNSPHCQIDIQYETIPEDDNELTLPAVEPLLRTAFVNLMENGCRHSDNNRMTVYVDANSEIKLRFVDNGPGIPEDELAHIFEPFYRTRRSEEDGTSGLGIGLALTKRIVKLHQGRIEVNTRLGEGTEFVLYLPVV